MTKEQAEWASQHIDWYVSAIQDVDTDDNWLVVCRDEDTEVTFDDIRLLRRWAGY